MTSYSPSVAASNIPLPGGIDKQPGPPVSPRERCASAWCAGAVRWLYDTVAMLTPWGWVAI